MGSTIDVDLNGDMICYLLVEMSTWVKTNKVVEGIIMMTGCHNERWKKPYMVHIETTCTQEVAYTGTVHAQQV